MATVSTGVPRASLGGMYRPPLTGSKPKACGNPVWGATVIPKLFGICTVRSSTIEPVAGRPRAERAVAHRRVAVRREERIAAQAGIGHEAHAANGAARRCGSPRRLQVRNKLRIDAAQPLHQDQVAERWCGDQDDHGQHGKDHHQFHHREAARLALVSHRLHHRAQQRPVSGSAVLQSMPDAPEPYLRLPLSRRTPITAQAVSLAWLPAAVAVAV